MAMGSSLNAGILWLVCSLIIVLDYYGIRLSRGLVLVA